MNLATLLANLITSYEASSHWKILAYAKILRGDKIT
ncbi:hypothetical protein NEOC65_002019 [Neochlamydia sp. AcF65]|nr:hypothetical protein [Neochlamydia sp. AcF65]